MSSIVNEFSIFREFPKELKQNIKLFHVFYNDFAYCVTNDDKVYGLGYNISKRLGYNQSNDNKSYVLIQQFCDKRIQQFFGYSSKFKGVFFARSETNVIYSWGRNYCGLLGRGSIGKSDQHLKPEINEFFSNKNIIQIS